MSNTHKMIPIQLTINPANHEKIAEWRAKCLWQTFDDRDLEYFIRDIQKCAIKSGLILIYDDDGQFKSISFRAKKIMEPKNEDVVIRIKHLRKNSGMTFDDKIDILNKFYAENDREPTEQDVVDGVNLGKFYVGLKKNRDKYQFFLDHIGKLDEMDIEVEEDEEEKSDGSVIVVETSPAEAEAAPKVEPKKEVDEKTSCDELVPEELPKVEEPKKNKKSKKSKKE